LSDDWQKVQGRFEDIDFLEPAYQALRIVAAAFATPETTLTLVKMCWDELSDNFIRIRPKHL
jgi:hypothetical protein